MTSKEIMGKKIIKLKRKYIILLMGCCAVGSGVSAWTAPKPLFADTNRHDSCDLKVVLNILC